MSPHYPDLFCAMEPRLDPSLLLARRERMLPLVMVGLLSLGEPWNIAFRLVLEDFFRFSTLMVSSSSEELVSWLTEFFLPSIFFSMMRP